MKENTLVDCRNRLLNRISAAHNEIVRVKIDLENNLRYINETQASLNKYKTILHGFLLAYRLPMEFDITEKTIKTARKIIENKKRTLCYLFLKQKYLKLKRKEAQRRESKALYHLQKFDVRMEMKESENGKK